MSLATENPYPRGWITSPEIFQSSRSSIASSPTFSMKSNLSSKAERVMLVSPFSGTPPNCKEDSKYKTWLRWFFSDSWTLEYLAMTIAVTSLLAIAITLTLYDGQPLDNWPHSIKLNTVLSTLATVMKGFMLMPVCACLSQLKWLWYTRQTKSLQDFQTFDMASRGPWGALQLLYRLKFWHMASIGSLVTLLSLASDAFVQQSVSYPLQVRLQKNTTATIPYTQYFDSYESSPGSPHATQPLLAAIYDGVFSKNLTSSTSSIRGFCPTGNCTFPSYASLAVCSNCQNVTSFLQYTTKPDRLGDSYIYTLPNGHTLASAESGVAYLNISASTGPSSLPYNRLPLNSNDLSIYQSAGTIANISLIFGGDPSTPWNHTAWDCVLSFCAKSYNASDSLGFFNETTLDVFDDLRSTIHPVGMPTYKDTITFNVPSEHLATIGDSNRTFSVNTTALQGLQNSLGQTLLGETGSNVVGQFASTSGIAQGFDFNGVGNAVRTVANIADALTNAMRLSSGQQVKGAALVMQAHIQVQWLWLILPLVMVILAATFLALTVWRTHKSDVPSWRSSVLAVMEHGINTSLHEASGSGPFNGIDDVLATAADKEKVSDLEVWADDVSVRLRRRGLEGNGLGLTVS